MRIIAGKYSSRKLMTRAGQETRPTLDKVREAVFSSLGGFFCGGVCLDLYAGSGAVGLEALSRGMDQAILVDCAREAIQVIRSNITALEVQSAARVLMMKDMAALQLLAEEGVKLSLVYLDPPYAKQKNAEVLAFLAAHDMMVSGGCVVLESQKQDQFPKQIGRIYQYKEAVYGITRITYYKVI